MQYLNTFLTLLSKTESRDKILRLVQYATLHSEDHSPKGATYNIYTQVRRTRKILRLLGTIQYFFQLVKYVKKPELLSLKIWMILEKVFLILFYLFDHVVLLSQLGLIDKTKEGQFYPLSMKMYLLQNVAGAVKNVIEMLIIILQGKYQGEIVDVEEGSKYIKSKCVQFLKNILDILVAIYYLHLAKGEATRISFIGVVTSLTDIAQSLKLI